MTESNHNYLNEQEAANLIGVKPQTLAVWRSSGRYSLPFVKVGRLVRYRVADLNQWMESRTIGKVQLVTAH